MGLSSEDILHAIAVCISIPSLFSVGIPNVHVLFFIISCDIGGFFLGLHQNSTNVKKPTWVPDPPGPTYRNGPRDFINGLFTADQCVDQVIVLVTSYSTFILRSNYFFFPSTFL